MESSLNVKLVVATHKKYRMPEDSMYIPLHVGAEGKEDLGYQKDNVGENISQKNPYYCELTGLYWAWKNLNCDYFGLVHYRRHYKKGFFLKKKWNRVLSYDSLKKILKDDVILLPKRRHYFIETNRSQYLHAHHAEGLENTEKAIQELYPDYIEAWNKVMNSRSGHRFNMYIMTKQKSDAYCKWLFDILFEVEKRTDVSSWTKSEQRIFGYLSERLLDVWIMTNGYKTKDIPYMFMEKQNWFKKGFNFIKRKFKRVK